MSVNKKLLAIIACPKCNGDVKEEKMFFLCEKCNLAYPVLNDVPNMLVDEAWTLEKAKKENFKHKLTL